MKISMLNEQRNSQGGIDPSKAQLDKFEHADLITLPADVSGTNCGNCRFFSHYQNKTVCIHEDLHGIEVNARMCCLYWDNVKVKRLWKLPKS